VRDASDMHFHPPWYICEKADSFKPPRCLHPTAHVRNCHGGRRSSSRRGLTQGWPWNRPSTWVEWGSPCKARDGTAKRCRLDGVTVAGAWRPQSPQAPSEEKTTMREPLRARVPDVGSDLPSQLACRGAWHRHPSSRCAQRRPIERAGC
jgi:hypothetical protein